MTRTAELVEYSKWKTENGCSCYSWIYIYCYCVSCGTVCLNSFGSWTSPSDNSNDCWKCLQLAGLRHPVS